MTGTENVKHTQDQEGNPIVVMSEKQYKEMQKEIKRLRVIARENYLRESFKQVKDVFDGKAKGRPARDLIKELRS